MPGPLPDPNRRRRNAPTIPTTNLSADGRQGDAPDVPSWCELGVAGTAWWAWAWATPQALAWGTNVGMEAWVARRASLEDDLAHLERVDGLDLADLAACDNPKDMLNAIRRVSSLATGRLSIVKEMREMDDRLGLTPKGLAALRWTIVTPPTEAAKPAKAAGNVTAMDDRRKRVAGAS